MSSSDRRRALGKIVSVTADTFTVELNANSDSFTLVGFDAQHYVARIGSFVLIPLQTEYVVAEVVGLRERERASSEKIKSTVQDDYTQRSLKFLDVVPIGSLAFREGEPFRFGVSVYPPLYSDVLYTESHDLDRIFEVADAVEFVGVGATNPTRLRAFDIGTSVVFDDYHVKVRVDEFFGGHCAILGNTGSGKSCTVAAVVQSVFEKPDANAPLGASFVVFDTNGEYRKAFAKLPDHIGRLYALVPGRDGKKKLPKAYSASETTIGFRLPHWFLSPEEWELLLRASERTQRPILRTALGLTSLFASADPTLAPLKNHILASAILAILASSESSTASVGRIQGLCLSFNTPELQWKTLRPHVALTFGAFADPNALPGLIEPFVLDDISMPDYANAPFEFAVLEPALDLAILYEESHGNRHIRDYCSSLLTRYKSIRDRSEFEFMRPKVTGLVVHESSAALFVEKFLGLEQQSSGGWLKKVSQITIIDMNQVEDEVVEVLSAVMTRMIFERLRRAEVRNGLPVNLILEEAHRYVSDRPSEFAIDATRIFERVAKEGRKYGLFLLLASQRPSELASTVLSQCSNFVVHRIQNPEDLQHVRRMTPFISESVLSRLPSLPKQHALIFGNSVNVPTTFRVRDADPTPKSDDAEIRKVWFVHESTFDEL